MKIAKIVFSAITIIAGGLGIARLIPYSAALPIAFVSLAVLLVLSAEGYKKKGDKGSAYIVYALAGIIILVAVLRLI